MNNLKALLLVIAFLTALTLSSTAQTNLLDPTPAHSFEGFAGSVTAIAKQADGKVIVGGYFKIANTSERNGLARFNTDGSVDASFNPSLHVDTAGIRSIVPLPDGKILVGGLFSTPSPQLILKSIARLNADGSEDTSFSAFANSTVNAIAVEADGKILIGGQFSAINNAPRLGLARLNPDGSLDSAFGFNVLSVTAIAIQPDGNILIGGSFVMTSPVPSSRIIRISPSGAIDAAFSSNASVNDSVLALKLQTDGKIVLGGTFSTANNVPHNALARLNADGTLDTSFNPSVTASSATRINSIGVGTLGEILIGGTFSAINGTPRKNIVRLNSDGTIDTSFAPQTGTDLSVQSVIAENDGRSLIGGDFFHFDGVPRFRIARLNVNGTVDAAFGAETYVGGSVHDVAIQPDGKIVAVGNFSYVSGILYGGVVRFNDDGSLDPSLARQAQNQVWADPINDVEIQPDGKILLGGRIYVGNRPFNFGVIRLNSDGSVDTTFTGVTASEVTVVKNAPNGQILVGGYFSTVNGIARTNLARLNANGSLDATFNPNVSANGGGAVTDIFGRNDGKILIGGFFSTVGTTPKSNIALLNADGTVDPAYSVTASSAVTSIAPLPSGDVLIGGSFSSVNGTSRNRVARLSADGRLVNSFNPDPTHIDSSMEVTPYPDGRVILSGAGFKNLIVLNADGSLNNIFWRNQWFNDTIQDVKVQADGKVLVAGHFSKVGTTQRFALARLDSLNVARKVILDFDGDGKTDIGIFRPGAAEWWLNRSSNGATVAAQFGNSSDKILPADFTADGKADIAVWRPATGQWFVLRSENGTFYSFEWGMPDDIPVVGDFDGDGKSDPGVYKPSISAWLVSKSSGGDLFRVFGVRGDVPIAADYDGDGKTDIAVYRPSAGEWWISRSSTSVVTAFQFGTSTDKPVPGDFTGDGKADAAFYRPSNGNWFVLRSEDSSFFSFPFGAAGDLAVPGDYDGDGKFDPAVFRPTENTWYINRSTAGLLIAGFGIAGDRPLPNVFVP